MAILDFNVTWPLGNFPHPPQDAMPAIRSFSSNCSIYPLAKYTLKLDERSAHLQLSFLLSVLVFHSYATVPSLVLAKYLNKNHPIWRSLPSRPAGVSHAAPSNFEELNASTATPQGAPFTNCFSCIICTSQLSWLRRVAMRGRFLPS